MQSLPRAGAALTIRATAVRPLPNIGEIIVRQSDGTENVLPLADIAAVFAPGECLCGAPTEGKWADKHSADCPAIAKPTYRELAEELANLTGRLHAYAIMMRPEDLIALTNARSLLSRIEG